MSEVAVAVVSWNTKDLLRRCLESFRADAESGLASVWVVDNGSTDDSREMVAGEFGWVNLVEPESNLGFGPAVNLVAAQSDERLIAPANADIALRPGALATLVATLDEIGPAGIVVPRLELPDGSTQHSVHSFPSVPLGLALHSGLARSVPGLGDRLCIEGMWNPERRRTTDWAHGALMLVERDAFERAGRFDEEQWMYAEDLDLCWGLARAGYRCVYEPRAVVLHELSAATRKAFDDEERQMRHLEAASTWMRRRRGRTHAATYSAINVIGAGTRSAALTLPAAIAPSRYRRHRERYRRFAAAHARLLWAGRH